jgi:hypothetical protein
MFLMPDPGTDRKHRICVLLCFCMCLLNALNLRYHVDMFFLFFDV